MKENQEKLLRVIIKKTGVSEEIALRHLEKNQYKVNATLKNIEKEIYTDTELILKKYKDKETALTEISFNIAEKHQLPQKYLLNFKDMEHLPSELYAFMVIIQWLNYEDYEDFEIALFFQLEEFTTQIEDLFGFTRLAKSLERTEEILSGIYKKYKKKSSSSNTYSNAHEEIWRNEDFQKCERLFRSQKALIIEKLYEFTKININKFP